MQSFEFEPIGTIETCYPEKFGTPRQPGLVSESWGIIRLRPDLSLTGSFEGLDGFSHLWVLFVFHQNTNKVVKAKVHPPRLAGEKIGVFATRSPHRPNPIGLSVVKIERIENNAIYVSGVDLVNGTPILDVKPYLPSADNIEEAKSGWAEGRESRPVEVEFSEEAIAQIESLHMKSHVAGKPARDLKKLIQQNLELDPRPVFYKGEPGNENPYMDHYGFGIEDLNVVYKMNGRTATVLHLEPWTAWKDGARK